MSTSTPYQSVRKLYFMHFCYALVSRMWDMSIVLLTCQLTNNSMTLVAASGFLSSFSVFSFMPMIGKYLDQTNRMTVARMALSSKVMILTTSYGLCAYLFHNSAGSASQSNLIYCIPFLYALATLSFSTITQSIEKDWLVVLSAGNSDWLTTTNSVMSQIDLGTNAVGPTIAGILMSIFPATFSSVLFLVSNMIATMLLYYFMSDLYNSWPQLAIRDTSASASNRPSKSDYKPVYTSEGDRDEESGAVSPPQQSWLQTFVASFSLNEFFDSGCAGIMIAYSFLYLTVLSFGSLMTVYVRWAGLSDHWIGICRGIASVAGFLGATIFPTVKQMVGIRKSGLAAIWYQWSLVVFAASSFYWMSPVHAMLAVVVGTLFSRTGLWLFDLVVRQIAQETILESHRGKVNGQWRSMIAFFDMSMYIIAIYVSDPQKFWILCTVSAGMVTLAAITYTATSGSDFALSLKPSIAELTTLRHITPRNKRKFSDFYTIGSKLGVGSYAAVYQATSKSNPPELVAVKIISKSSIPIGQEEAILQEIDHMRSLNHPNIVKYIDTFEDDTSIYLVLERLMGGELFERVAKKLKYDEAEARTIFITVLNALKYLHDRSVVHRDIKPENLLMVSEDDDAAVKLADFGFAKVANGLSLKTSLGSPYYMAPEILNKRNYGKPVDLWALGVVTYVLVRGRMPFETSDGTNQDLFECIKRGTYQMTDAKWNCISIECKDMIRGLLEVNETKRFTVEQALRHPWLAKNYETLSQVNLTETLSEIKRFNAQRKFKAAVHTVMAIGKMASLAHHAASGKE